MNLTSPPEEACASDHAAHVAFLDIHRAFDALSHKTVVNQVSRSKVRGRLL